MKVFRRLFLYCAVFEGFLVMTAPERACSTSKAPGRCASRVDSETEAPLGLSGDSPALESQGPTEKRTLKSEPANGIDRNEATEPFGINDGSMNLIFESRKRENDAEDDSSESSQWAFPSENSPADPVAVQDVPVGKKSELKSFAHNKNKV